MSAVPDVFDRADPRPVEFTGTTWDLMDRLEAAVDAGDARGVTPSMAARKAHTDTVSARRLLEWMAAHRYVHTTGNGAWTRYYPGRGR